MPDRTEILSTANSLITTGRAKVYGEAMESFSRIAELWAPILGSRIAPDTVALCLLQLKIARAITSPAHVDSWIDMCGYATLGGELAEQIHSPFDTEELA